MSTTTNLGLYYPADHDTSFKDFWEKTSQTNLQILDDLSYARGPYDSIFFIEGSETVAEDYNGRTLDSAAVGTDDAGVINAAIAAVPADGGRVVGGSGIYTIETPISVGSAAHKGIEIIGSGRGRYGAIPDEVMGGTTFLQGADCNILDLLGTGDGDGTLLHHADISDINFECPGHWVSGVHDYHGIGIRIENAGENSINIERCSFLNLDRAITYKVQWGGVIRDCLFWGNGVVDTYSDIEAISPTPSQNNDLHIEHNIFENPVGPYAINTYNAIFGHIENNFIEGANARVLYGANGRVVNNEFYGTLGIESSYYHAAISSDFAEGLISGNTIVLGNSAHLACGIMLTSDRTRAVLNNISGYGWAGIIANETDPVVEQNVITVSGEAFNGAGILMLASCARGKFNRNVLKDITNDGIRLQDGPIGNTIKDNTIYGCTVHDIYFQGYYPTNIVEGNTYIFPGEIRTYRSNIATLTENAFNSLDNPFGKDVALLLLDVQVVTGATATAPNIDCGIGSSATADYTTLFDDLPGETPGFYKSTISPGTQTVPQLWQTGAGNRYLNMSIKDAAATGMVATYIATVMGI